jgi:Tol biopolymer transport system component/tRNA A-37 threonylcarbamoyl transferase component Bud32
VTQQSDRLSAALTGRYRIERELGQGGMATVYLAEDLKHQRKVAIKVLKEELGAVLGVERFLSEIKVTANLQHPNLLPLFDSGEADGLLFYVMPFIQGETLRTRLANETVLSVDEAVRIASAMARALDYAHRQDVIHRDLKPENVMLQEGQPIIADFGIALAVTNAGGARLTQTGLSVGTPHYMSPEQAMGEKAIDRRSDIYALAALTYEMLAGEPPHTGPTAAAIIARVVMDEPRSLRAVRSTVPEYVDQAIARGLAKQPADRWSSANEFAEALTDPEVMRRSAATMAVYGTAAADAAASATSGAVAAERNRTRQFRQRFVAAATVAVVALVAAVWGWQRPTPTAGQRARFALAFGDSVRLRTDRIGMNVAVSNDGSQIAWLGGDPTPRIFTRTLDDATPRPVAGSDNAMNPQFSPDGTAIAFIVAGQLKRVPLSGGPAATIADEVVNFHWGDADVVVYSRIPGPNAGLWSVSASGGSPTRLTTPDTTLREGRHVWPHVLPGAKAALFAIRPAGGGSEMDSLAVIDFTGKRVTRLGIHGSNPRYAPTGHLLFSQSDGTVRAISFDASSFEVTAPQVPVMGAVAVLAASNVGQGGAMTFAFAANGTMVYQPGSPLGQLVRVTRGGVTTVVQPDTQRYSDPRFSPDGKRILMAVRAPSGKQDIWINTIGGTSSAFTTSGMNAQASWTPDGNRIAWRDNTGGANRPVMFWSAADGSTTPETLIANGGGIAWLPSSKGGFTITTNAVTSANLDRFSVETLPAPLTQFVNTPATETAAKVSPDGAWLAYTSNQSGRAEVYVCSTSDASNIRQISTHGGDEAVWAPSGRELFYRDGRHLISAQVETKSGFVLSRRDTVMTDIYQVGNNFAAYDVMPDGQSFVMIRPIDAGAPPMIVLGWFTELKERMAQGGRP